MAEKKATKAPAKKPAAKKSAATKPAPKQTTVADLEKARSVVAEAEHNLDLAHRQLDQAKAQDEIARRKTMLDKAIPELYAARLARSEAVAKYEQTKKALYS